MKKQCKLKVQSILLMNFTKLLNLKTTFLVLLGLTLVSTQSYAKKVTFNNKDKVTNKTVQQDKKTIKGNVKDADGNPLPGVNIFIKGTTKGTITDPDGNYVLNGVSNNDVLVIKFIGMSTQEISVSNKNIINTTMKGDAIGLDEVVAIGYTVRKKGEITGSVSSVNSKTIERTSNSNLAKSLAGKVPGLIVSDRGGYPGDNTTTLLIRGKSTLNNNSPLILIDGVESGSFSDLSPQDIKSLTVLKDGAAAIYGARAANGVILVTTKRGKAGKPVINLSSSYNLSTFSAKPNSMSSAKFCTYQNEIAARNGNKLPYTDAEIAKYAAGNDPNYPNTDWSDLTYSNYAPESRTSLSISGGADKVNYFVSGDYLDKTGMYASKDLGFKQYQVRSNIDIKPYEFLKLGVDLSGRFGKRTRPGVSAGYITKHIYTNLPTDVGIYPNGKPGWGGENGSNPIVMSSNKSGFDDKRDNDLRAKFSFDLNLDKLTKGLSVNGYVGLRRQIYDQKNWYTPWTVYQYNQATDIYKPIIGQSQLGGSKRSLKETFWKFNETMLNATIHYNRTFGKHTFRGFVGYEQSQSNQSTFWTLKKGFPSDEHSELFAGSNNGQEASGVSQEWARVNYFASLSYDYKKRYFIDLTLRRDGSANFGPGKRFGTFPGIACSWAIGDESFMDWSNSWLNDLKIRTSWAIMGNDRVPSYQYLTRYQYGGPYNGLGVKDWHQPNSYIFGTSGTLYNSYRSNNVPNPDITWEKADMKNIGINFTMLDRRLTGDINYYYQKRTDILIARNASIPDVAGLKLPQENLGKVDSYGCEVQLGWNDKVGAISYNIGANLTQAKNKVVYMDEAANVPDWRKKEGHPMDSYIVWPTAGIFKDKAQVDATKVKRKGTTEGEPIYVDTDGNGKIDQNDAVRSYSSVVPEIQYGISGGVGYKNWNLNFLFQGQTNAKMLVFFDLQGSLPNYVFDKRWTPNNRNAQFPRAFSRNDSYSGMQNSDHNKSQYADLFLKDASFLRLKELELSYSFKKDKIKFGDLKVFVRGTNLLTLFSDIYKLGLDPESTGYDNFRKTTYPSLKTYSVGFNLKF